METKRPYYNFKLTQNENEIASVQAELLATYLGLQFEIEYTYGGHGSIKISLTDNGSES